LEETATEMFDNIIRSDNITINMDVPAEPDTLKAYIEKWRMKVWDTAFTEMFKGADAFKKSNTFKDYRSAMLAIHCLIYRYKLLRLRIHNHRSYGY